MLILGKRNPEADSGPAEGHGGGPAVQPGEAGRAGDEVHDLCQREHQATASDGNPHQVNKNKNTIRKQCRSGTFYRERSPMGPNSCLGGGSLKRI